MTTEPAMIHGNAPASPVLTAQRSRSHRIQCAVLVGVLMLAAAYVLYHAWQEYFRDPTTKQLFIAIATSPVVLAMVLLLKTLVGRKVEFFENYLVAHSLWVFSRKRSYREISKLKVLTQYVVSQYFVIVFSDGGKIGMYNDEIHLEELVGWLEERGVPGAGEVRKKIVSHEVLDRLHSRRKSSQSK